MNSTSFTPSVRLTSMLTTAPIEQISANALPTQSAAATQTSTGITLPVTLPSNAMSPQTRNFREAITLPADAMSPQTRALHARVAVGGERIEPQPFSAAPHGESTKSSSAASDSGSEDVSSTRRNDHEKRESNGKEERRWKPKSLRAEPTDEDPFGDRDRIPHIEFSAFLSPTNAENQQSQRERAPPFTASVNGVHPVPSTIYISQAQNPQTLLHDGAIDPSRAPASSPVIPFTVPLFASPPFPQTQQQHAQQHPANIYYTVPHHQNHAAPTIIVIPSTLADSLGQSYHEPAAPTPLVAPVIRDRAGLYNGTGAPTQMYNVGGGGGGGGAPAGSHNGGGLAQSTTANMAVSQLPQKGKVPLKREEQRISAPDTDRTSAAERKPTFRSTSDYNRTYRDQQRDLLQSSGNSSIVKKDDESLADASRSSVESAKMHIMARPQLLLNVFTFWINLIACHGTVNHNQCVHAVLSELRQHFLEIADKKRRRPGAKAMTRDEQRRVDDADRRLQQVLDALRENLDNRSYDTTRSVVDATNAVGPYVLRHFLLKRGVISLDPHVNDTAVVWASLIASSDPTLPFEDTKKITDPSVMLQRMAWSKCVSIPGV